MGAYPGVGASPGYYRTTKYMIMNIIYLINHTHTHRISPILCTEKAK